jgi:hypothetical protein
MKHLGLTVAALLGLSGTASAQWFVPPPFVVQPPPVVVQPPPLVVQPPPVLVPPPPPPPPPPPVCVVTGPPWVYLNLRTGPNGWPIGSMPPGTPLALLSVGQRGWGFVQTPLGITGWAFLPYTTCGGGF